MKLAIFGAGYSGRAIGAAFANAGFDVIGTSRSAEKAVTLEKHQIRGFVFDGSLSPALSAELAAVTHLVQSIAPGEAGDPLLSCLDRSLKTIAPGLVWAGYLSTVGVYGDHGGAWVDEETPCRPVSPRSRERVAAEKAWQTVAEASGLPLAILRLSGIYGPGRNGFVNLEAGQARRLVKKDQVFNRIRVEDIAAAALFLAARGLAGIYNVTDDEPAPPQDVVAEAARLMEIAPPPEQAFETATLSPMARSFYGENKRVSNERIKALGFRFAHPDYRRSLAQLWGDGRWRGEG